jgi:hypothetical protein
LRQVIDFSSLVNWVTGEKHIGTIDESGEAQMAVRDEVRITLSRARRFCDKLFAGSFRQEF